MSLSARKMGVLKSREIKEEKRYESKKDIEPKFRISSLEGKNNFYTVKSIESSLI